MNANGRRATSSRKFASIRGDQARHRQCYHPCAQGTIHVARIRPQSNTPMAQAARLGLLVVGQLGCGAAALCLGPQLWSRRFSERFRAQPVT